MTRGEFEFIVEMLTKAEDQIHSTKGVEYTNNNEDVLVNFKRVGKDLGIDPAKVCMVYILKHMDALKHIVMTGKPLSESIESRILDIRVYMGLLLGLLKETHDTERVTADN